MCVFRYECLGKIYQPNNLQTDQPAVCMKKLRVRMTNLKHIQTVWSCLICVDICSDLSVLILTLSLLAATFDEKLF